MRSIPRVTAVAVAVVVAATATVVVTRRLNGSGSGQRWEDSLPLQAAVRSAIVRTLDGRAELAADLGRADPIRLLGAEALSHVMGAGHRVPPTVAALRSSARAEVAAGSSPALLTESVALSAVTLGLPLPISLQAAPVKAFPDPAVAPAEELRLWAASEELAGRSTHLCLVARSLIARSLLRALLAWPLRGCVATPAEAGAVGAGYAGLGDDGDAARSLAAAVRITGSASYKQRLEQHVVTLQSNKFPDYLTSDAADSMVLSWLSGVQPPPASSVANYIYQQRMTSGGLAEAGQESGASVGYGAELVRSVLHREPMLADPLVKLRGATEIVVAGPAAYELATGGPRDSASLRTVSPEVYPALQSYPGIIAMFFGDDCAAVRGAIARWVGVVESKSLAGAIDQDPSLAVLLVADARAVTACADVAAAQQAALHRMQAYADDVIQRGARTADDLGRTWAAARIACLRDDPNEARRIVASSGFTVVPALSRARSIDDLYFIARLARVHDGSCASGIAPW